jgi:hypothetical protein
MNQMEKCLEPLEPIESLGTRTALTLPSLAHLTQA